MEAYIIAERVLTKQHMENKENHSLRYLKRYDMPRNSTTKQTFRVNLQRQPFKPRIFNVSRNKQLLRTIAQPIHNNPISQNQTINKYFFKSSDFSKDSHITTRQNLLYKNIEPSVQIYDANLKSVIRRAPCWAFNPQKIKQRKEELQLNNVTQESQNKSPNKKPIYKVFKTQNPRNVQFNGHISRQQQRIYEELKERAGWRPDSLNKINYSAHDFARNTTNILKKYHLETDSYFKKFLTDLPR